MAKWVTFPEAVVKAHGSGRGYVRGALNTSVDAERVVAVYGIAGACELWLAGLDRAVLVFGEHDDVMDKLSATPRRPISGGPG